MAKDRPCPRNACQGGYGKCLDVKLTNRCNARCAFCIEQGGWCPPEADPDVLVKAAVSLTDYKTVLVLGGEPMFDMDRLESFLKAIRPYKRRVYMTTNGCFLGPVTAARIAPYLDGVNVSVHYHNEDVNNKMVLRTDQGLSFPLIRLAADVFHEHGCTVRFNANLVKGRLDSVPEVLRMIAMAQDCHADSIRFTELQDVGDDLFVDATQVFPALSRLDAWTDGCEQRLDWGIASVPVTVKLACGCVNPRRNLPKYPVSRCQTKVLYPNGTVTDGWVSKDPRSDPGCHGFPASAGAHAVTGCHDSPRRTPCSGCH